MTKVIHIAESLIAALHEHAARAFPEECCGILIGTSNTYDVWVQRVIEATNTAPADRRVSYQIDWPTLFRTVRAVRNQPEEIVGFYHSHPDGSRRPSARDLALAWVDYSYPILSMVNGRCTSLTSWRIAEPNGEFEQERITKH